MNSPIDSYVSERSGMALSPQQLARLSAVVSQRLGSRTQEQYLNFLRSTQGTMELLELLSSVSVHKTDLFRDEDQLEAVRKHVILPLAQDGHPMRVWSAGCSTGEEVATLLILLEEAGASPKSTVMGTDIAESALLRAKQLIFTAEVMRRVPLPIRDRYFKMTRDGWFSLCEPLRSRASFVHHNLADAPYPFAPGGHGFDLIFCRNVLIYFTPAAFDLAIESLARCLSPNGVLVLSAAEPMLKAGSSLKPIHPDCGFMYTRSNSNRIIHSKQKNVDESRANTAAPLRATASKSKLSSISPQQAQDGEALFQLVLDWAALGEPDSETEEGLKRCLALTPDLACARYLLGVLHETQGKWAEARDEYQRAWKLLSDGRARVTPFYLNNARLLGVCELALGRLKSMQGQELGAKALPKLRNSRPFL